mgnify:CR=1 FL=1
MTFLNFRRILNQPKVRKRVDDENERLIIFDEELISWRIFDILQVWIDAEFKIEPSSKMVDWATFSIHQKM